MAKPPIGFPPTVEGVPVQVTLYLGKSEYTPVAAELFDLYVPASQPAPVHPDEASFHPLPEIKHTFRSDQKLPPKIVSAVFSGLVVAPWFLLLGLVRSSLLSRKIFSHHIFLIVVSSLPTPDTHLLTQHPSLHCQPRGVRNPHLLLLGQPQARPSPLVR